MNAMALKGGAWYRGLEQLQEPVWQVSKGLERVERLCGSSVSGSFKPVEKERLGLPQPIVWQLHGPV